MRALALWSAIPGSALAIASLELLRLPAGADATRWLGGWLELVRSAGRSFLWPGLLLAAAVVAVGLFDRARPERRRWALGALAATGVAQAALAREVLIAYHPFSWHVGANLAFVGLGAALAALHVGLSRAQDWPRLALGAGAVLGLAALAIVRAHYAVYVGLYPTLHQCLLHLAFVTLALGIALALRALVRAPRLRPTLLPVAAMLLALAMLEPPASAWARPAVVAYTELGRGAGVARALEEHREELLPEAVPGPRSIRPDPDALARFGARSGLPPLEVSLEDHDVLLVLSDATRWDRTSLARGPSGPTPHLARLARTAQVFDRAYAPSNGTFPSLASILAMRPLSWSPVDLRPRHWRGSLRDEVTTAAEALRAGGRSTFWVGHDLERSLSRHARGLERGFDERVLVPERRGDPADREVDRAIADRAIEAIEARRGERWLGLVFFVSPHDDYRVHDRSAPHETPLERYDQELSAMDAQLGRLLEAVDLERTIVIFAGDHGEAFGEHGHRHHLSSVHEEQIHVPLVIHVPSMAPARHAAPTSLTYLFPWLMLRSRGPAREAALDALRTDLGPWMRALDGAVVSELVGRRRQEAALVWPEQTVLYDVFADLPRLFDASDPAQLHDLREAEPARFGRLLPRIRGYRRLRFEGRRFRFVTEER